MDLFLCPLPTALTTIAAAGCPERFGQIQKFAFQRLQTTPSFTPTSILLQATWTPLLAATDSTKVVISPFLNNVIINSGDALTEGGNDNTTLNGIARLLGLGYATVTAELRNVPSTLATALRALTVESAQNGYTNLWCYMFNGEQKIIADKIGSTNPGFPVYNLVVTDVHSEGFNKDNIFKVSFSMAPGWSENFTIYKPTTWNPLTL